ncbi:hypothetical protein EQG49_09135 [Periweissella cryptocerci]|uniref:Uncharacterized protein n=1 Tax=Periweissella cryptocerci TaxID=2506420 RepID=A0A4P6YUZ7_9LACO|nr:hypothetical protein [Periweissella cryptocerci]QBO36624.1 hypothetical protein EQG49_09135 [Periweissella cryptocerci]
MLYEEVTDYVGADVYGYIQPVTQLENYLYFVITPEVAQYVFATGDDELPPLPADAVAEHVFEVEMHNGQIDMHNKVDHINVPGDYPMQKRELRLLPSYLLANYFDVLDDAEDAGNEGDFTLQRNQAAALSTRYGVFSASTRTSIMHLI